ncbi:MAG: hypothetical protein D6734_12365 [Candidatus Schekmanbacteria bacterium]|nr:MAG: hypothetical protein D6734_12365 [Candidatus Schekmanbacteria bacterium]
MKKKHHIVWKIIFLPLILFYFFLFIVEANISNKILWKGYLLKENGEKVFIEKVRKNGKVIKIFRDSSGKIINGNIISPPSSNKDKITKGLKKIISSKNSNDFVRVIIFLKQMPLHSIVSNVEKKYEPQIIQSTTSTSKQSQNIQAKSFDNIIGLDIISTKKRRDIFNEIKKIALKDISTIEDFLHQNGGIPKKRLLSLNAVAAVVPLSLIDSLVELPLVSKVDEDRLMSGGLYVSVPAIGSSVFWNNGYTGGIWDVAILDSGIDETNPALSGHSFENHIDLDLGASSSYFNDDAYSSNDLHGHGTAVCGVVASLGSGSFPGNLGVSYGIDTILNLKSGFLGTDGNVWMYWSDAIDSVDWALFSANEPADIFNHSYGSSTSDDDSTLARFWDSVVDDIGAIVTICAGNSGTGLNKIWEPSIAYNVICTAAINDNGTLTRTDDSIASFSSRGPTAGGRKKPDLAAPGYAIYTTNHNWETEGDYRNAYGTSFASPHIAGACALLMNAGITSPKAIKAILINTAEDKGIPGWDNEYGWGYIDLNKAWLERNNYFISYLEPAGSSKSFRFYKGQMANGNKATLVWHRHQFYNPGGNYPVWYYGPNDLDLEMYKENDNTLLANSVSGIDNVEQIVSTGNNYAVIKVFTPDTSFSAVSTEEFAIALPAGFSEAYITPTISVSVPAEVMPGEIFNVSAVITNSGNVSTHYCYAVLTLPSGFTIINGTNAQTLGSIFPNESKNRNWSVKAGDTSGSYNITVDFQSTSYGELLTASTSSPITISEIPTEIKLSSFSAKQKRKKVHIVWQTASETNNIGFNIWRREDGASDYTKINEKLIKSKKRAIGGAKYHFNDKGVKKGKTYFYRLEDIEKNLKSNFHKDCKITIKPKPFKKIMKKRKK